MSGYSKPDLEKYECNMPSIMSAHRQFTSSSCVKLAVHLIHLLYRFSKYNLKKMVVFTRSRGHAKDSVVNPIGTYLLIFRRLSDVLRLVVGMLSFLRISWSIDQ